MCERVAKGVIEAIPNVSFGYERLSGIGQSTGAVAIKPLLVATPVAAGISWGDALVADVGRVETRRHA